MTVNTATSAEVFRAFVSHELVPRLRPGDAVVMDNLSAQEDSEAEKLIGWVHHAGYDLSST